MGKKVDLSKVLNDRTYINYYNRLRDYALSMFEWKGLPDTVNVRFLELKLYELGSVVFFKDPTYGFVTLPVNIGSELNLYEEPTKYIAYSVGYEHKELDPDDAAVIWNNYARHPIQPIIQMYAHRLYEITRTQDVNVHAQKTPVLLLTDDAQRLTLENVYDQFDGNQHAIFGNKKGFDPESVKVLKTDAPYVADKLQVLKHDIWNECMTFLGVGNAKQDKKERLVADEVAANDEQVEQARHVMLDARRQACEEINRKFNLNVSVDFKLNNQEDVEAEEIEDEDES